MTAPDRPIPAEAGQPVVIRAEPADLDALSQVLADAFDELAPTRWLVPDPDERHDIFVRYFQIYIGQGLRSGIVLTTPDRTGALLAFHVAAGPRARSVSRAARLSVAASPGTDRFIAFNAELDRHHPSGEAHYYLAFMGVRPDRQGRGTGTALLRAYHRLIDSGAGAPSYLEASIRRLRGVYRPHGYRDLGTPIRLPGGPLMYPMWRERCPD